MQINTASASALFGPTSADSIIATTSGSVTPSPEAETARVTIRAQKREINRLRGYKLELTPAENQRLSKIQAEITKIERKASAGTVRNDEVEDRADLLAEADEIIGKPTVDVDADQTLAEYAALIEAVLEPNLDPVIQRRVDSLERISDGLASSIARNPESETLVSQYQSVTRMIDVLKPQRHPSELSVSERKVYDDIADLINEHTGEKIQLSARDSTRVAELENSILELQGIASVGGGGGPTPAAVARAYSRLL